MLNNLAKDKQRPELGSFSTYFKTADGMDLERQNKNK